MFIRHTLLRSFLMLASFLSVCAITSGGHFQSQQRQALPKTAEEWFTLGLSLSQTTTDSQEVIAAFREAIRLKPDFEAAYLQLSSALNADEKYDEQIAVLSSAREYFPASMEVMKALREILIDEEHYADLLKILPDYLSLQPLDASAHDDLGWVLMHLKRYDEAAVELEKAIAIDGKLGPALQDLASVYDHLGRKEESLSTCERLLEVDPNYVKRDEVWRNRVSLLMELNRIGDAWIAVEKALEQNPESASAYYMRGFIYLSKMNIDDAISDFKKVEQIGCPYRLKPELYVTLGSAYLQISQYPEAIEDLKKAVNLKPDSFQAQSLLALAYGQASLCEKAMEPFEKAIALEPESIGIYNNLSVCLMKLGRLDDAEKGLRYSIRLDPENAIPRLNLGMLLVRQKRLDEAESELRKAVRMDSADWKTYSALADLLLRRQNLAEAVPLYRQALRLHPEEPMLLNNLGYTLAEMNQNLEEALDLTRRAVKARPHNAAYRDSLGWAYFKLGKLNEAERELTEVIGRAPKSAAGFEHLGDVKQKLGKKVDARECWKTALSLILDDDATKNRLQAKINSR